MSVRMLCDVCTDVVRMSVRMLCSWPYGCHGACRRVPDGLQFTLGWHHIERVTGRAYLCGCCKHKQFPPRYTILPRVHPEIESHGQTIPLLR